MHWSAYIRQGPGVSDCMAVREKQKKKKKKKEEMKKGNIKIKINSQVERVHRERERTSIIKWSRACVRRRSCKIFGEIKVLSCRGRNVKALALPCCGCAASKFPAAIAASHTQPCGQVESSHRIVCISVRPIARNRKRPPLPSA